MANELMEPEQSNIGGRLCNYCRASVPRRRGVGTMVRHRHRPHGAPTPVRHTPKRFHFIASSPQQYFGGMDNSRNDPAEALLRTYSADGGINYLDAAATLPSRPAVDEACVELLSLLFPGFHGEPILHSGDLAAL